MRTRLIVTYSMYIACLVPSANSSFISGHFYIKITCQNYTKLCGKLQNVSVLQQVEHAVTTGPWLRLLPIGCDAAYLVATHQIFYATADPRFHGTGKRRITTFRSTTDRIYDGGPIIL